MSEAINPTATAKAGSVPAKKVRFKDPACKGINVPNIGAINETHLSKAHIVRILKRDAAWFSQHFIEE